MSAQRIDTVAGIEMFAVDHLKYIRCEICQATFDSAPKSKSGEVIRAQALQAGWLHVAPDSDYCPEHASMTGRAEG